MKNKKVNSLHFSETDFPKEFLKRTLTKSDEK